MFMTSISKTLRVGIITALTCAAVTASAQDVTRTKRPEPRPEGLRITAPLVETLLSRANLSGTVGFVVADAKTGAILDARNPNTALPPASVNKALTTLFALGSLGGGYRFETQLVATGPIEGGRLNGDLILVGGGDPTLGTDQLALMARDLRVKGVTSVSGAFRVYDGALPWIKSVDDGQPEHVGYNPSVSGLNLNFNRVHFEWKRSGGGYAVTMEGRTDAHRPAVSMAKMQIVSRETPVYTYASKGGVDLWTVAQGALGSGGSRWLPVRNSSAYAGDVFRTLARGQGITLPAAKRMTSQPSGTVITRHQSLPLERVLLDMMKFSTNLTAEAVGLTASQKTGLRGSASAMNTYLGAMYGVTPSLVDHSGLGDKSRITAAEMATILSGAYGAGRLAPLMKPVVIRDKDGKAMPVQPADVRAKTGSLNFVSALAGYITTNDGRDLVFAIFTADQNARRAIKKEDRERPAGGRTWAAKSRQLQHDLLARWAQVYGG